MIGVHTDLTSMKQPSPAASRMRRSRARRRRGEAVVSLDVRPGVITDLVALGWLAEPDRVDKGAIARALTNLVERAILARATPCADSQGRTSIMCDLPPTTVETLIGLRWLPADHARDVDAIGIAFRRFAGRALGVARRGAVDLSNVQRR